jgi:Sulfotransferase family
MNPLHSESLKHQAATNAGLADFGDDPFAENFARLVQALNTDGELSVQGLPLSKDEILRLLRNRLELRAWLTDHPEILDEPIARPILLMGLPRSGTTFLQNLFDHDDGLRLPRTWETLRPCPPPAAEPDSVAPRIEAADRFLNGWRRDVPNFDATHLMDVTGPDECAHIMSMAFTQAGFQNYAKVPSYFDWLLREADFGAAYHLHKTVLQLLQWRAPARRWVLKYPNHMLAIGNIRAVYPDAVCVVTHRDPVRTLASLCALTEQYRAARYDTNERAALGREMLHFVTRHIERFMAYRGSAGDEGIVDVDYYRLVADPVSTVAAVYHRTNMSMPDTVRDRLAAWSEANPKGRRGRHDYRLADYGLDADQVSAVFAGYRRRFGVKLEN